MLAILAVASGLKDVKDAQRGNATCASGFDVYDDCGTGGPGAVVLNVTDIGSCCAACGGYSCFSWTFGPTGVAAGVAAGASANFPPHNCAIMSSATTRRNVSGHSCGVNKVPPAPAPTPAAPPFNADISCDVMGAADVGWRCLVTKGEAPTSANNCHAAGPGTVGNTTCACGTPKCSDGKPAPANASAPQYLQIGDSVSLGAMPRTFANLSAHGIECEHNPGNAASANNGAHCQRKWVQADTRKWDVISFQYGLHDLAFDEERISVQQYRALLANLTDELVAVQKAQGTKLIWVTTTPVPTVPTYSVDGPCNVTAKCLNPPRFDADVRLYNAAAASIISAANAAGATIETLDLYALVIEQCGGAAAYAKNSCPGFQLPANVHFADAGWQALASVTVQSVLKAISGISLYS